MNQKLYKPNTKESHQKVQAKLRAKGTNNPQALPQSNKLYNRQIHAQKASRPQSKPLKEYNIKTTESKLLAAETKMTIHPTEPKYTLQDNYRILTTLYSN
jgi:hypothetical protein